MKYAVQLVMDTPSMSTACSVLVRQQLQPEGNRIVQKKKNSFTCFGLASQQKVSHAARHKCPCIASIACKKPLVKTPPGPKAQGNKVLLASDCRNKQAYIKPT